MEQSRYLIIGSGPAGLAAVQAIRTEDKAATITLVTRENALPYSPTVLPYLISGELKEEDLFLKGKAILKAMNAQILLGKEVAEILHLSNEVRCTDGERIGYDKLLISTGASPQMPSIDHAPTEHVHTLRTCADFARLSKALAESKHIAIYGAGLVAVEAAEKLCRAGHSVTIIARSSLLRKYFSPKSVTALESAFAGNGCRIVTHNTLVSVVRNAGKLKLTLSNSDKLTADELIVATGVAANGVTNSSFEKTGDNLRVGRHMETSVPNIYAAGDVAASPSFFEGEHASCAILPEAVAQGRVAGTNMAGGNMEYRGWIRCNYLRCFEDTLFSMGITDIGSGPACSVLEQSDGNSFLRLLLRDERIVGAEGMNMTALHPGIFLSLIRDRVAVSGQRNLLLSKPREASSWLMQRQRSAQTV
jgi:phenylglyoxylate dehydrogenase epsilon subunit